LDDRRSGIYIHDLWAVYKSISFTVHILLHAVSFRENIIRFAAGTDSDDTKDEGLSLGVDDSMLTFVGLGLYDLTDIPLKGYACIRGAEYVFLEAYTSRLAGCSVSEMAEFYGHDIQVLSREEIEGNPEPLFVLAKDHPVVFLTGGDPMVSTTHIDLRIRAKKRGIETRIIHASSISTAVCGLTGLQNYRFGKSCSLPYPYKAWSPQTPFDVIRENRQRDLHTRVYLDIKEDRCMTIPEAVEILEEMSQKCGIIIPLYIGVARAGSETPIIAAGNAARIRDTDFGPPLHILVIPASLHVMEQEYLELFAGYDS